MDRLAVVLIVVAVTALSTEVFCASSEGKSVPAAEDTQLDAAAPPAPEPPAVRTKRDMVFRPLFATRLLRASQRSSGRGRYQPRRGYNNYPGRSQRPRRGVPVEEVVLSRSPRSVSFRPLFVSRDKQAFRRRSFRYRYPSSQRFGRDVSLQQDDTLPEHPDAVIRNKRQIPLRPLFVYRDRQAFKRSWLRRGKRCTASKPLFATRELKKLKQNRSLRARRDIPVRPLFVTREIAAERRRVEFS